jgi:hypothetical protein
MHGGAAGTGAPFGNKNAFRHGHYAAEAIAQRRVIAELLRLSRATLADLGRDKDFSSAWGCSLAFPGTPLPPLICA